MIVKHCTLCNLGFSFWIKKDFYKKQTNIKTLIMLKKSKFAFPARKFTKMFAENFRRVYRNPSRVSDNTAHGVTQQRVKPFVLISGSPVSGKGLWGGKIMRDEDATDASSITQKCSPEWAGQEEREREMYKYRQRANWIWAQTDDCRENLMRHPEAFIHQRVTDTSKSPEVRFY